MSYIELGDLGAVLLCDEIKGLSRATVEKLAAGSQISAEEFAGGDRGDAAIDRKQLIEIAREAQKREARSARISAGIAIASVTAAVIGLYINYQRTQRVLGA
jgi:hypothetical protein